MNISYLCLDQFCLCGKLVEFFYQLLTNFGFNGELIETSISGGSLSGTGVYTPRRRHIYKSTDNRKQGVQFLITRTEGKCDKIMRQISSEQRINRLPGLLGIKIIWKHVCLTNRLSNQSKTFINKRRQLRTRAEHIKLNRYPGNLKNHMVMTTLKSCNGQTYKNVHISFIMLILIRKNINIKKLYKKWIHNSTAWRKIAKHYWKYILYANFDDTNDLAICCLGNGIKSGPPLMRGLEQS